MQDDDGFLWFATKNGLNRYDGYHFKVFRNNPFDSLSLNNNEVVQIVSSGDFIVVLTKNHDLMLFHRQSQRFYTIRSIMVDNSEICLGFTQRSKNSILYYAHDGQIYFTYQIRWPEDLSQTLLTKLQIKNVQQFLTITRLCKDNKWIGSGLSSDGHHYWSYTVHKTIVRDLESGKEQELLPPPLFLSESCLLQRCAILPAVAGATWVYYLDRLARWDGQKWEVFRLSVQSEAFLQFDRTTGMLWVGKDKSV